MFFLVSEAVLVCTVMLLEIVGAPDICCSLVARFYCSFVESRMLDSYLARDSYSSLFSYMGV